MTDPDFILTFPLYVIVMPEKGFAPLVAIFEDPAADELRGVALFTEELFAERTRDAQVPSGELWKIATLDQLKADHLPLFREWGYDHVAVDTHETTGRGGFIPIEDLEK